MSTSDMKKARVWAKEVSEEYFTYITDDSRAAIKVIQSLPDVIVDGDKLRQVIDFQGTSISEEARKDLESLLTPSLPTLAELIEQGNDPQKYVGMQCMMHDFPSTRVITKVRDSHVSALREDLTIQHATISKVTPLPDLPRLEWPAQEPRNPETPPAETLNNTSSGTPRNPRPEDVPAGEPWLVGIRTGNGIQNDQKFFGIRSSGGTWELFDVDEGWHSRWGIPSDITLISRLVPEDKP